jgi:hypothetical protein
LVKALIEIVSFSNDLDTSKYEKQKHDAKRAPLPKEDGKQEFFFGKHQIQGEEK